VLVIDPGFRAAAESLLKRLGAPKLTLVEADGSAPMLTSIQAALRSPAFPSAAPPQGFWLWPVDAPFLSVSGWKRACATARADPESIWKLRAGGKTGHPIWFPGWSVPEILIGSWPNGLLGLLASLKDRVRTLPLDGELISDFNTPESLASVPESL
jgi:CTP:molybdopterin cytidylyltransferase MocA